MAIVIQEGKPTKNRIHRYPWGDMEEGTFIETEKNAIGNAHQYARYHSLDWKFRSEKQEDGTYRIYRIK